MLMCMNDFTIFSDSVTTDHCPIDGCLGTLVRVDRQFAQYISDLNHALKKRGLLVRTKYSSSPKLPTVFKGFVEFYCIPFSKDNQKRVNDLEFFKEMVRKEISLQQSFTSDLVKTVLLNNKIELPVSETPFSIKDIPDIFDKKFRLEINPITNDFIKSSIFNLSMLCTISSASFNILLTRITNNLHNMKGNNNAFAREFS